MNILNMNKHVPRPHGHTHAVTHDILTTLIKLAMATKMLLMGMPVK